MIKWHNVYFLCSQSYSKHTPIILSCTKLLKDNRILKYFTFRAMSSSLRNCPFSSKWLNLSWIQISCFTLNAHCVCSHSLAPQHHYSLLLLSSGSEASSPFVARLWVAPGQTEITGEEAFGDAAAAFLARLWFHSSAPRSSPYVLSCSNPF